MMPRALRAAFACTLLAASACESGFFPEKPSVSLTPVYGALELDGKAKMESGSISGGKTANDFVDLRSSLNVADRDTAVGATLGYGDGFAGVEFGFLRWEQRAFDSRGTLEHDFGDLLQGDTVESDILYQNWRLEYLAQLAEFDIGDKAVARVGLGAGVHHNDMRFEVDGVSTSFPRAQDIKMRDTGMPILRARAEAEWRRFRGRIDFGFSDGHWGDVDGRVTELQLTANYDIARDVSLFAGWRSYDLPLAGDRDGRLYEFDAELRGWIFGLRIDF